MGSAPAVPVLDMTTNLSRSEAREQAFILVFERVFTTDPISELLEAADEIEQFRRDSFTLELAEGATAHADESDKIIEKYAKGWKLSRISKVALSIMRLAIFEMFYRDEIPVSVSIDEAVELAKKYGGEDDSSFVNGVLGGIARGELGEA